jgi:hypothetical protein
MLIVFTNFKHIEMFLQTQETSPSDSDNDAGNLIHFCDR